MGLVVEQRPRDSDESAGKRGGSGITAARETLGNRFVYVLVSPRARGLSVGVNLNPDRRWSHCSITWEWPWVSRA